MGLTKEERTQLADTMHSYVEKTYPDWQTRREFFNHLIALYREAGLDGLSLADRATFLELVEETL